MQLKTESEAIGMDCLSAIHLFLREECDTLIFSHFLQIGFFITAILLLCLAYLSFTAFFKNVVLLKSFKNCINENNEV
jgi:hypothetical protein